MIISEKQILKLIIIAEQYADMLGAYGYEDTRKNILRTIDIIEMQQSEELKVIE